MALSFDAADQLRKLSLALAVSPMAVAAACLAWVVGQQVQIKDEMFVAIDGLALLRLPIDECCTLASLAANAAAQLSAASEHVAQLAEILAARPERRSGILALAVSPLPVPQRWQLPLEPALLLSLPAKGGATLHSFSSSFTSETVGRLAQRIGMCGAFQPGRPLVEAPLMEAAEARFILTGCNRTAAECGPHHCLHAAFRAAAVALPTAVALRKAQQARRGSQDECSLTYADLDGRSHSLCAALLLLARDTLTPERRLVGVVFERSAAMVVALLGVLKVGAGYLPIEPNYPAARVSWMLIEATPAAVLMGEAIILNPDVSSSAIPAATANANGELILGTSQLTMPLAASDRGIACAPPLHAAADDPVYVMYTSGSTGRPKGVVVTHRPLLQRISWMRHAYPISVGDAIPFKTQVGAQSVMPRISLQLYLLYYRSLSSLPISPRPSPHLDDMASRSLYSAYPSGSSSTRSPPVLRCSFATTTSCATLAR